jgi:hypothetical protein
MTQETSCSAMVGLSFQSKTVLTCLGTYLVKELKTNGDIGG